MTPNITKNTAGVFSNGNDYRQTFLCQVHRLLQLSYESLTPTNYSSSEEDDITGEICKRMTQLTEEPPVERWMGRYSIHEQYPQNEAGKNADAEPRGGKRRSRIDIRIVSKTRTPNVSFYIEAKHLYRGDSVDKYAGDEGLGAYTSGYYAKNAVVAGMLGYVQRGSLDDWLPKLETKIITADALCPNGAGKKFPPVNFRRGPRHVFMRRHSRSPVAHPIEVYHTFFLFI
jgi:hypothetical protein